MCRQNETPMRTGTMTTKDKVLERIVRQHLNIETLAERKMDSLDFHEVSVWSLKAALDAAFRAGASVGVGCAVIGK